MLVYTRVYIKNKNDRVNIHYLIPKINVINSPTAPRKATVTSSCFLGQRIFDAKTNTFIIVHYSSVNSPLVTAPPSPRPISKGEMEGPFPL